MRSFLQKILLFTVVSIYVPCVTAQTYQRIVSLAPSLTQNLYYLNAGNKIVGCTSYCEVAKNDKKTVVASAIKINVEKIVSLKPDLVLASGLTNADDIESLKKFNIKVLVFHSPKSFAEICSQFNMLGDLVGKRDEANTIIADCNAKVLAIEKQSRQRKSSKIFFQIGANPLFAVISNNFMHNYMDYLNAVNITSDLKQGSISRETVLSRNPDCIFIATMGIVGEEEKNIWSKYKSLNAARYKRIYIIDSELACQPTPITFVKTLEIMGNLLNKR